MGYGFDDLFDLNGTGADAASAAFDPLTGGADDQADEEDPYALGELPRTNFKHVDPELARRVIAEVQPEGRSLTGFASNAYGNVRDIAGGFQTLISGGLHGLPKLPGIVGHAVAHPLETAGSLEDFAGAIAQQYKEKYTPREGEGTLGMLGRVAYEKPFDLAMDASALLQGPAGLARLGTKVGLMEGVPAAAEAAAQFGRSMDPFSVAAKGLPIAKALAPDTTSRYIAARATAEATGDLKASWRLWDKQFHYALHDPEQGAFAGLNEAEKQTLFAYGEGRFQLLPESGEQIPSRAGEPLRKEAMDQALQRYDVIQQQWDERMGRLPEQAAELRLGTVKRQLEKKGLDPTLPEHQAYMEASAQQAAQEAEEQMALRRTVSMRTTLDEARQSQWQKALENEVIEGRAADIEEASKMIPRPVKPTPAEAMELMGPGGGTIFHHSMEALTRDQSTVGAILSKFREASVWKDNTGQMYKEGLLDQYDVERASWAAHAQLSRGNTLPFVAQRLVEDLSAEGLAKELPKGYKKLTDPEMTGGTHQLIAPGYLHLQDLLRGQYHKFLERVLEVGDDAAVSELNIPDLTEAFMQGQSKMFKLKPEIAGKVYKIPKGAGDEFARYDRSLRPNTSVVSKLSDAMLGPWHFTNLRLAGTKLSNDAIGDMIFGAIQGVHPFSLDGIDALTAAGSGMKGRYVSEADIANAATPELAAKLQMQKRLAKVYDLPGVAQGAGNVLLEGEYGINKGMGWFHDWLENSKNPVLRGVGKWGRLSGIVNEHIDDYWRAASTIYELKKTAPGAMKGMFASHAALETFADYVDKLGAMGADALHDADFAHARKAVDHFFPNYDKASATDRAVLRHIAPYHKFYRHAAKLLLTAPFERPAKMQLARELGKRAQNDVKETLEGYGFDWNTMVREDLRTGVPVSISYGEDGSPTVMMLNSQGPNPFSFLSGNDLGEAGLGAIHPIVKIALEQALGVNLFSQRKFLGPYSEAAGREVDPVSGEIVDRKTAPPLLEHFLRQFRVYNTAKELVAQGRVPVDTASLLDMLEETPVVGGVAGALGGRHENAYQIDPLGRPETKPLPWGRATALVRQVGVTPQALQAPSKRQMQGRRSQMATLFNDIFQRHPELQQSMMELMQKYADEIGAEEPRVPIQPRAF